MSREVAANVSTAASTSDGRVVYVSLVAYGEPQSGLSEVLERVGSDLASTMSYWELFGDTFRRRVLEELEKRGYTLKGLDVAVSYRCPGCGAPVELNPEAVIYVCKYCGWAGDVFGKKIELYTWKPVDESVAVSTVLRIAGRGKPTGVVLRFVPYWVFRVKARVEYGARVVYEVEREKRRVRREKDVEGVFEASLTYPLTARLNTEFYGDEEMATNVAYNLDKRPPVSLEVTLAKRIAPRVLAPEVSREEAEKMVRDSVEDIMAERAKRHAMSKVMRAKEAYLYKFRCDVELGDAKLVLAPYWFITYEKKGSAFSGAISGIDGDLLRMELPVSPIERALRLAGSWIVAALTALGVEYIIKSGEEGGTALMVLIMGAGVSLALARAAFAEAKERR